jgi:hypothetical protein
LQIRLQRGKEYGYYNKYSYLAIRLMILLPPYAKIERMSRCSHRSQRVHNASAVVSVKDRDLLRDANGKPSAVYAIGTDITALKRAEELEAKLAIRARDVCSTTCS